MSDAPKLDIKPRLVIDGKDVKLIGFKVNLGLDDLPFPGQPIKRIDVGDFEIVGEFQSICILPSENEVK